MITKPWAEIVSHYAEIGGDEASVREMLSLTEAIARSQLAAGLYGWTSMADLCVAQTPVTYPYDGPFLRISPLGGGQIELRYIDTQVKADQWHRTVDAKEAFPRLLRFLHELRWFPRGSLPQDANPS